MNCVTTNEMIAAILRLEARYEADPTLFDDHSAAPLGHPSRESVNKHFALLRRLATEGVDIGDIKWREDGQIYTETDDGTKKLRLVVHRMPPNILEKMDRLLVEEIEEIGELDQQANANRRLAQLIRNHLVVKG